jgi:hypothetical protein
MKKIARTAWEDIINGKNLDLYLIILITLVVMLLSVLNIVESQVIFNTVLAVLAILSGSLLVIRHNSIDIQKALQEIKSNQKSEEFFIQDSMDEIGTLTNKILQAKNVVFWGTSFSRFIPLFKDDFEKCFSQDLDAKFLLLKPDGKAIDLAIFRGRSDDVKYLKDNLFTNLRILSDLQQITPPGSLDVRTSDYIAPYTLVAIDPDLPNGSMVVWLAYFRTPNAMRPMFELLRQRDDKWFDYFMKQFELVWSEADPIKN